MIVIYEHIMKYNPQKDEELQHLLRENPQRAEFLNSLEMRAKYDAVTGLPNKLELRGDLKKEYARARRYGEALSVVFGDAIGFKQVNDDLGHLNGDIAIQYISASLRTHTRESDVLAKWGGDEFGLILPKTDSAGALALATKIANHTCYLKNSKGVIEPVTLKMRFGIVSWPETKADTSNELFYKADQALLKAKETGKSLYLFEE